MLRLLPVLLCVLFFAGCGNRHHHRAMLQSADSIVDTDADSALALLRVIDTCALRDPADRALYALLTARALDKTGVELTSDSVVAPAVAYYTASADPLRYAMSQYYLGRARYNSDRYASSLAAMFAAHDAAKSTGNHFWIAMTARGITQVYSSTNSASEQLFYATISYDNFKRGGYELHAAYGLLDKAYAYMGCYEIDECCALIPTVLHSADSLADPSLSAETQSLYGSALYLKGDYDRSISVLSDLIQKGISTGEDSAYMGLALAAKGRLAEAGEFVCDSDSACDAARMLDYVLSEAAGDSDVALKMLRSINDRTNELYLSNIANDMSVTMIDCYERLAALERMRLAETKKVAEAAWIVFVLILLLAIASFLLYRRRKELRYEEAVGLAREIQQRYDARARHINNLLHEYMRTRYGFFNSLCNTLYEDNGTVRGRRRIYAQVEQMISDLSQDSEEFKRLVALLDSHSDNIASDFMREFPSASDKDFRLFVFSALGFSNNAISLLMRESGVSKVYARRRHLKERIRTAGPQKAARFLSIIDVKYFDNFRCD